MANIIKKWWKEAVVYQVYPRSFMDSNGDGIGDLQGVISKLDYIKDLGAEVIWLCPMYKSPNDDNGYDISDYQAIMDEFGTMADFDQLLTEVHKRGMKLILDLVLNHTSDEHPWFVESRSSKDNPKRDWYIWADGTKPGGEPGSEPNNWESIFNGSAWVYDEATEQWYMHIFSKKQPDVNWENPEARKALYDMVNWWLDKGIDGYRVDAITHIKKAPGFPNAANPEGKPYANAFEYMCNVDGIQTYMQELKRETFAKYDIMTVGEASGVKLEEADQWIGPKNGSMNMVFQFDHLNCWYREPGKYVDVIGLKKGLTRWQKGLEGVGWNAIFFENHDQPRTVSSWTDNHPQGAKMLGAFYFFMQGTPFIYQGQELGMTNVKFDTIQEYNDVGYVNFYHIETAKGRPHDEVMAEVYAKCRDNSRTPMQWTAGHNAGFTTGTPWIGINENYTDINVEAQQHDVFSNLNFYKKMIQVRKNSETLLYGTYDLHDEDDATTYTYTRTMGNEQYVIICNFTPDQQKYNLPKTVMKRATHELILHNYSVMEGDFIEYTTLQPYETRVYKFTKKPGLFTRWFGIFK